MFVVFFSKDAAKVQKKINLQNKIRIYWYFIFELDNYCADLV